MKLGITRFGRGASPSHLRSVAHIDLVAITYPDEYLAGEAAKELDRRAEELRLDPDATAAVVRGSEGSPQLAQDRRLAATPGWREFWSGLLASVVGGGAVEGLEPGFCDWLRGAVRPGNSVLVIVVSPAQHQAVLDVLIPFGGTSITSPLADDLPEGAPWT